MQAYKVTDNSSPEDDKLYFETKDGAKAHTDTFAKHLRPYLTVELVEVKTDKATICSLLSGNGCEESVLRQWGVTERGGWKEEQVGQD